MTMCKQSTVHWYVFVCTALFMDSMNSSYGVARESVRTHVTIAPIPTCCS